MTHTLIDAGPGSGKSTTLINTHSYCLTRSLPNIMPTQEQFAIMNHVASNLEPITPEDAVFVCMTNAGKEDLLSKMRNKTRVFTYNGLGASGMIRVKRNQRLNQQRGKDILSDILGRQVDDLIWKERRDHYNLLTYLKHCKEELLDPTEENFLYIQQKYGIEYHPPENEKLAQDVFNQMRLVNGEVEWIDQIWLTTQYLKNPLYKIGYVDECQDLSNLKLLFMLKMCEKLVFCGDPFQAINGFAGANYKVFETTKRLSSKYLTLKTCFRCPPNHVEHINTIRPARLAAHKTEDVPVDTVNINHLGKYIRDVPPEATQLMVARLNNTLLQVGIKLLNQGIQCQLLSRSGDSSIEGVIRSYIKQTRCKHLSSLKVYVDRDIERSASMQFQAGTTLREKASCVLELMRDNSVQTIQDIFHLLDQFSGKGIPLSTVHKAKGLEADYVYILYPPIPMQTKNDDQAEQEINLSFVAESRSRHKKIYVRN